MEAKSSLRGAPPPWPGLPWSGWMVAHVTVRLRQVEYATRKASEIFVSKSLCYRACRAYSKITVLLS